MEKSLVRMRVFLPEGRQFLQSASITIRHIIYSFRYFEKNQRGS
jgi:hypothetical protein